MYLCTPFFYYLVSVRDSNHFKPIIIGQLLVFKMLRSARKTQVILIYIYCKLIKNLKHKPLKCSDDDYFRDEFL